MASGKHFDFSSPLTPQELSQSMPSSSRFAARDPKTQNSVNILNWQTKPESKQKSPDKKHFTEKYHISAPFATMNDTDNPHLYKLTKNHCRRD